MRMAHAYQTIGRLCDHVAPCVIASVGDPTTANAAQFV
jgi:hypothetical protein